MKATDNTMEKLNNYDLMCISTLWKASAVQGLKGVGRTVIFFRSTSKREPRTRNTTAKLHSSTIKSEFTPGR